MQIQKKKEVPYYNILLTVTVLKEQYFKLRRQNLTDSILFLIKLSDDIHKTPSVILRPALHMPGIAGLTVTEPAWKVSV